MQRNVTADAARKTRESARPSGDMALTGDDACAIWRLSNALPSSPRYHTAHSSIVSPSGGSTLRRAGAFSWARSDGAAGDAEAEAEAVTGAGTEAGGLRMVAKETGQGQADDNVSMMRSAPSAPSRHHQGLRHKAKSRSMHSPEVQSMATSQTTTIPFLPDPLGPAISSWLASTRLCAAWVTSIRFRGKT